MSHLLVGFNYDQTILYTGAYKKFCGIQTVESIVLIPQNVLYLPVCEEICIFSY